MSGWGNSVVNPTGIVPPATPSGIGVNKPGDFVRGGFWVSTAAPEAALNYVVVWPDIPGTNLRAKGFALPRGMGNQ